MNQWAAAADLGTNMSWFLGGMLLSLAIGTALRLGWPGAEPRRSAGLASLKTWWVLALLLTAGVVLGRTIAVLLVAAASLLGLREFFGLTSSRTHCRRAQVVAYLAIPLNYFWILVAWYEAFWMCVPVLAFLGLSVLTLARDTSTGFLQDVGIASWGTILLVFCLSHTALLLTLPAAANPAGGAAGWMVYLIVLTQVNDIAQALWGRQFGRRKVTPRVSPHKTWEGFGLGAATTVALAVALGPVLTPFNELSWAGFRDGHIDDSIVWAAIAGSLIAVGGFCGDITMSAVKRDLGVKDSGSMLPGQGGILDRVDSLTFTAPLFFYYALFLHPHS